jgi:hypothetical protein
MQFRKALFAASAAVIISGGIVAVTQPASAHVVCNREGDCWSTHANVKYPSDMGVRRYSDRYADQGYRDRRWGNEHRTWREDNHDHDRGAYRNGLWVTF